MKRILLAVDIQAGLNTPGIITETVNKLGTKIPVMATVLCQNQEDPLTADWLEGWSIPQEDSTLVNTKYVYNRNGYMIPPVILATLKKNGIEEVIVTGAHSEGFLLAAGFSIFDAGIKASLLAPMCLTGQYHQHTVTLKIWEHSIGPVYETVSELGLGIS